MREGRFILCGSFGSISGNVDELPSMAEIAARAKTEDPKLYREIVRRGWLNSPTTTTDSTTCHADEARAE